MTNEVTRSPEYQEVSALELHTYLDDIRQRLLKDAPEWHIVFDTRSDPNPRTFYHLARFDFTKGKDQTWPIPLHEFIFAYEVLAADLAPGKSIFFILNQHPLGDKR